VGDVIEQVNRAIAMLEHVVAVLEPGTFDADRAARLVEVFARGERLCAAGAALSARRVDEAGTWKADGHRTAAHWLASATGSTIGVATDALKTVRALDVLPATADAFIAGELSCEQAGEIVAAALEDPSAESELLETARSTSLQGLRDEARRIRNAAADDAAKARRLYQSRRFHRWIDRDGAHCGNYCLPPVAGARLDAAIDTHLDKLFTEARRAGRREHRDAYAADALVALAEHGPRKPVELRVTVDQAALRRGNLETGERCDLDGTPVPIAVARALLDDARVTVLGRDGVEITTVSSPKRTIPVALRRALEARYPCCGVIGCTQKQFLQIDHTLAVEDGGETNIENTWRLCTHHHDLKTYGGWVVVGAGESRNLVAPDRSVLTGRAPP
jgi:hypothetical protein